MRKARQNGFERLESYLVKLIQERVPMRISPAELSSSCAF